VPMSNPDSGLRGLDLADQRFRFRELQICFGFGGFGGLSAPEIG
jgi:hypothetical protein